MLRLLWTCGVAESAVAEGGVAVRRRVLVTLAVVCRC